MSFTKGHKPTEAMKAKQREGQVRRWAKFHADRTSPEAVAYSEKISVTQKRKFARYSAVMALLA